MAEFKRVEDIIQYVKERLAKGELTVEEAAKFARIQARQGRVGEEVVTVTANGLEETKNTVKLDEKTGEPGWIVTNPGGEQYIVSDSVFKKKYEIDPENPSQYKPKGGPVLCARLDEDLDFDVSWGNMKIAKGGYLMLNKEDDVYGIQEEEFNDTYAKTEKSPEQAKKEAMEMFGVKDPSFSLSHMLDGRNQSQEH